MDYSAFYPGRVWLDTNGQRIQAHGGSMFVEGGVFYWYGENKEKTVPGGGIWHWGVRCYSSTDLYNWTDLGLIVPPDLTDTESPLHPSQLTDRPHIIRHPESGKYLCWLKTMTRTNVQETSVLVADSLLGPYTLVKRGMRPLGMNAGDFDLVVDPDDGKTYYYFERVHSELICADVTSDLRDVTGYYSTHFPHPEGPPVVREAPAHFRRNGFHYLVTSGTSAYFPNPSELAIAATYHGPWEALGDPHPTDTTRTSFRSQISCVFKHPDFDDLYIAMADRWLPALSAEESNVTAGFDEIFAEQGNGGEQDIANTDTSIADYVWLPFRFDGAMGYLEWRDEWTLNEFA